MRIEESEQTLGELSCSVASSSPELYLRFKFSWKFETQSFNTLFLSNLTFHDKMFFACYIKQALGYGATAAHQTLNLWILVRIQVSQLLFPQKEMLN